MKIVGLPTNLLNVTVSNDTYLVIWQLFMPMIPAHCFESFKRIFFGEWVKKRIHRKNIIHFVYEKDHRLLVIPLADYCFFVGSQ